MKRKPSGPAGSSSRPASKRTRLAGHGEEKTGGFDSEAPNDLAYHLPAEIWHRVFTLLPPKTLGRLLTVNKLFRTYLDPSSPAEIKGRSTPYPILPPMKPDAIWQASRRAFWPHMPGPLKDKSEVDMWRLCCSRTCQFCNSRDRSVAGKTPDQWNRGPGAKGVSPVFPFFIVSCGKCLSNNMVKVRLAPPRARWHVTYTIFTGSRCPSLTFDALFPSGWPPDGVCDSRITCHTPPGLVQRYRAPANPG